MGLWKNLKYVLSDECNGLLRLLVDNYNKKTDKSEKTIREIALKVQQTLETQEVLDNNLSDSYQELKENKEVITKVSGQCDSVFEKCDAIVGQISQMETDAAARSHEIEKIFEQALEKQNEEFTQRNQKLASRIREVYNLIEAQNAKDPDEPDVNELLGRIDLLEKKNAESEKQIQALQEELERTNSALAQADQNYQNEKRKTFDLSKKLVQANDKIGDLLGRFKDRALEDMIKKDETGTDSPFMISANKEKFTVTAGNVQVMIMKFTNTSVLDRFFEKVPDHDPYKKMYDHYQRNIRITARQFAAGAELEDALRAFLGVMQKDLIDKMLEAVSRRLRAGSAGFEEKLLEAVNRYLESAGFYSRDDIQAGNIFKEENYRDMECVRAEKADGAQPGEIVEVELYPYYINYIDKSGKRKRMHTQGAMAVAG